MKGIWRTFQASFAALLSLLLHINLFLQYAFYACTLPDGILCQYLLRAVPTYLLSLLDLRLLLSSVFVSSLRGVLTLLLIGVLRTVPYQVVNEEFMPSLYIEPRTQLNQCYLAAILEILINTYSLSSLFLFDYLHADDWQIIGWREPPVRHLLVLITDAAIHFAGDGKVRTHHNLIGSTFMTSLHAVHVVCVCIFLRSLRLCGGIWLYCICVRMYIVHMHCLYHLCTLMCSVCSLWLLCAL